MKILKKVLNLPFVLLISFVSFLIYKQDPTIADGIVTIALSGLYGYQMFYELQEQPNYEKEIAQLREEMKEEVKSIRDDVGRISMVDRGFSASNKKIVF